MPTRLVEDTADRLLSAARLMREQHGPEHQRHEMWMAMASWLETAEADLTTRCRRCCEGDCNGCSNSAWLPHVLKASTVANAYLAAV